MLISYKKMQVVGMIDNMLYISIIECDIKNTFLVILEVLQLGLQHQSKWGSIGTL